MIFQKKIGIKLSGIANKVKCEIMSTMPITANGFEGGGVGSSGELFHPI